MKSLLSLLTLILVITACRTKGPGFDPYAPSEVTSTDGFAPVQLSDRSNASLLRPPTEPYRLGPGDVIEIEALGESAGRATVTVGPDGKVYYSLLPGVSVWGLSLPESRALLQREMAKFTRATPELVINQRGGAVHCAKQSSGKGQLFRQPPPSSRTQPALQAQWSGWIICRLRVKQ